MFKEHELKACISGSLKKFKPEIDLTIDEFTDLHVKILAPEKWWVNRIRHGIIIADKGDFRPLPSEINIPVWDVEPKFLHSVSKSDFLYVVDIGGYIGLSTGFEIGFAMAKDIPVFSMEKIAINPEEYGDLWLSEFINKIPVATPKEVVTSLSVN